MRSLAIVADYQQLIDALRSRAEQLDVSNETIDAAAGWCSSYAAKLLARRPSRALGPLSMGLMLEALGLRLAVVEDPQALARALPRLHKRKRNGVHRRI
jgi:hypothetical protein